VDRVTAQPRVPAGHEGGGRFASYRRPPVPASRVRHQPVNAQADDLLAGGWEERTGDGGGIFRVRRGEPSVPLSVVTVCCAGCVYGDQL
jgi:hypothetical protein